MKDSTYYLIWVFITILISSVFFLVGNIETSFIAIFFGYIYLVIVIICIWRGD